ncbi:glycine cleavage system protein GcvH [Dermabacteraceae bacterium P13115]|nr:glycine cleavage system protein GcvH [Dermabacteraceae bacterium TAE3-ERU5]
MHELVADYRYSTDHEWAVTDGEVTTVGVTAFAAQQLGDVVYVELPAVGDTVTAGEVMGEVESTKSVSDLLSPVSGEVIEVNQEVVDSPEMVNEDPFGAAWLVKVACGELPAELLSVDDYRALIGE